LLDARIPPISLSTRFLLSNLRFCASIISTLIRKNLILLVLMLAAARAFAQTADPGGPPSTVRLRLGPLFANPTFGLTNAGVDDNVFNQADSAVPQRDFTMTVTPASDLWLRFGPSWISATIREDLVYYNKFASERSANTNLRLNWRIPFNRLVLNPGVAYLHTRERPGFEIDARSQRSEVDYNGSAELRVMSKSFVGVRVDRRTTDFSQDATFLGTNLRDDLNRTVTIFGVTGRHQLTPLTSITFDASREQDRFEFSTDRNTDSTQFTAGLKFDPAALVKGVATFGYRNFKPLTGGVPDYQGSTVAVDLSYLPLDGTKFTLTVARDVQYSYDLNQPYYLQTGATASLSQQIFGPVDVVGRIGAQRLEYRDRAGGVVAVSNREDHVRTYGGGIGYHIGRDLRIGFNVDHQQRTSPVNFKQYSDLRYGFAVTYGS
jgi:hypothetical protein